MRWSEGYAALQRQMHAEQNYGLWGAKHAARAAQVAVSIYCKTKRPVSILDYGCGNGSLGDALTAMLKIADVTNYDPFHPAWGGDKPLDKYDLVCCFDVMEHVEPDCVDETLKYIADRTKRVALFQISTRNAEKHLADGRNAHLTVQSASWWTEKLGEHFRTKIKTAADSLGAVCKVAR